MTLSTPNNQKKNYNRPKSAEPGSPLLRRALSPDRLHPRSAETKTSISPLAGSALVKVTPPRAIGANAPAQQQTQPEEPQEGATKDEKKSISMNLANPCGNSLPRIAEEKDSPTGTKEMDLKVEKREEEGESRV